MLLLLLLASTHSETSTFLLLLLLRVIFTPLNLAYVRQTYSIIFSAYRGWWHRTNSTLVIDSSFSEFFVLLFSPLTQSNQGERDVEYFLPFSRHKDFWIIHHLFCFISLDYSNWMHYCCTWASLRYIIASFRIHNYFASAWCIRK